MQNALGLYHNPNSNQRKRVASGINNQIFQAEDTENEDEG